MNGNRLPAAEDNPTALLEMYKLSVEMADRISARRGASNTLFLGIHSAVIAALGLLTSRDPQPPAIFLVALTVVGMVGAALWWLLLRSYRDLNEAKFKVINSLETRLPAQPFRDEWDYLKKDPVPVWRKRYRELTSVERWVPWTFFLLNLVLALNLGWPK